MTQVIVYLSANAGLLLALVGLRWIASRGQSSEMSAAR